MEKKQKISMKNLYFVIVTSLGSNCQGVIIRGQYKRDPVDNCLGGNCPRTRTNIMILFIQS